MCVISLVNLSYKGSAPEVDAISKNIWYIIVEYPQLVSKMAELTASSLNYWSYDEFYVKK
jgi:hypothetical protein